MNNPDAIGGAERGEPMTRAKANGNHVNPNYFLEPGYRTNCQSCVVTFEARLRGYDVQTKANTRGSKLEELSRDTRLAWVDPTTGKLPNKLRNDPSKVKTVKQTKQWLDDTIQPGERYTFQHGWKGRTRSGHIVSADKDSDGNLRLYDPQCGKTYKGTEIDGYLKNVKTTTTSYGYTSGRLGLIRVDNLEFDPSMVNAIMEAKAS